MTNLLYTISLVLSTNWHALQGLPLEVQLVKKEHTATIVYLGSTNSFVLKTEWEALKEVRAARMLPYHTTNVFAPWWQEYGTNQIIITR